MDTVSSRNNTRSTFLKQCEVCGCSVILAAENLPIICPDCREKIGLDKYLFLSVDIQPLIIGATIHEKYTTKAGFNSIDEYTSSITGFTLKYVVNCWGFGETTFYIEDGKWHISDDGISKEFLEAALKEFVKNATLK